MSANTIKKVLNWCISTFGSESGDKLSFSIKQIADRFQNPTNSLIMEGNLAIGFGYLKANFISDSTYEKLLEKLNNNQSEEKIEAQSASYKK